MNLKQNTYFTLIVIHLAIGLVIYFLPNLAKLYAALIVLTGLFLVFKTKNRHNEVLFIAAYMVGAEALLRMTNGMLITEYGKYGTIFFMILGMVYSGISKYSFPYWVFLLFLLPGILYGIYQLDFDTNIRKAISFNISGPLCLGITSIYCFDRTISLLQMRKLLLSLGLPILATLVYIFLFTPSIRDSVTGTYSNFATSGGYGPNQISTILGLGTFVFFAQALLFSPTKKLLYINVILMSLLAFRGIVTFSRGGMITAFFMIILLMFFIFLKLNKQGKNKILYYFLIFSLLGTLIWGYSSFETGGLIDKRYANQDARGREKASKLTGRETLIESELSMFWEHPILGVGVGKNKEYREEMIGIEAASHNEISRMLGEQGMFGIFCLLILIITPLFFYIDNKNHIFLLSFFVFWALTINHAAMRLAAPAFIYALSLLNLKFTNENQNPLPR